MASTAYKLTYFNFRSRAEPIRLIFAHAGVPFEDNRIERSEWGKVKPGLNDKLTWGQLPILEFEGRTLAQSMTIARFLARRFNLTGANELEAAKCDEYVDAVMDSRADWKRCNTETDSVKKEELRHALLNVQFPKYLTKFEQIAMQAQRKGRKFLVGKQVTWADLVTAHTLEFYEDTFEKNLLADYPYLLLHRQNVYDLPRVKDWISTRPKTIK